MSVFWCLQNALYFAVYDFYLTEQVHPPFQNDTVLSIRICIPLLSVSMPSKSGGVLSFLRHGGLPMFPELAAVSSLTTIKPLGFSWTLDLDLAHPLFPEIRNTLQIVLSALSVE